MRIKKSFFYTLREDSSDDASRSGSLLTRAGMIKKAGSGLYVFMPMGLRVLRKVEGIIKEEMDRSGAQELVMPSMLPIDVYEQCGRVEAFGDGKLRKRWLEVIKIYLLIYINKLINLEMNLDLDMV